MVLLAPPQDAGRVASHFVMTSAVTVPGRFQCRECRQVGPVAQLDDNASIDVNGRIMSAIPLLPRCACYIRIHRGKLPAAVENVLSSAPRLPKEHLDIEALRPPYLSSAPAASSIILPPRLIYSVARLSERELHVYSGECTDSAFMGKVTIHAEHKLSDVLQMLAKDYGVSHHAQLSRGTFGEKLKVPLHRKQHARPALPFFPSSEHCLIVTED